MKRTRTSNAWLREHVNDTYVQRARAEGYRSRASFKLIEIDDKDHLIRSGEVVVDLGATPGGWSQVVAKRMKGRGRVIALDLLEMEPLHGVDFIQGDFREENVLQQVEKMLSGEKVGLVLSDMAPNMSGVDSVDQARAMYLSELAVEFADKHLKKGGNFLIKLFMGEGFDAYMKDLKTRYTKVITRKPAASRRRSNEVYALATGKR